MIHQEIWGNKIFEILADPASNITLMVPTWKKSGYFQYFLPVFFEFLSLIYHDKIK